MQRKTTNGFNQHSKKDFSSKEKGIGKSATYEQITYRQAFGLPPELMIKQISVIIKQNKLNVIFTAGGILGESQDFDKMIAILYNSVRYN